MRTCGFLFFFFFFFIALKFISRLVSIIVWIYAFKKPKLYSNVDRWMSEGVFDCITMGDQWSGKCSDLVDKSIVLPKNVGTLEMRKCAQGLPRPPSYSVGASQSEKLFLEKKAQNGRVGVGYHPSQSLMLIYNLKWICLNNKHRLHQLLYSRRSAIKPGLLQEEKPPKIHTFDQRIVGFVGGAGKTF